MHIPPELLYFLIGAAALEAPRQILAWLKRPKKRQFTVQFVKDHPDAALPAQGRQGDAAYDLCSVHEGSILPGETAKVSTGLRMANMTAESPDGSGLYIQFLGRGGKASEGIYPVGGVVDLQYRGELKVLLHNGSNFKWEFQKGEKIAQMALVKIEHSNSQTDVRFSWTDKVQESVRNDAGFGSSGR